MVSERDVWLIASYAPVALFSLRPSITTAAGGQTLLVPTPYAVKLALVDAIARVEGGDAAEATFNLVQPLEIRVRPADYSVVTHTFNRVRWAARGDKDDSKGEDGDDNALGSTSGPWATRIAYREYCFMFGDFQVAINIAGSGPEVWDLLTRACSLITYLGKRGGFFQFLGIERRAELGDGFDQPANPPPLDLGYAVVQVLDDFPSAPDGELWERINSFSSGRVELEKHRLVRDRLRVLAAERVRSNRTYTLYRRTR